MNEQAINTKPQLNFKAFLKTDCFIMLCIYFGALILHILMSLNTTIFNLTPDEYSVTAIGAYLNGLDWSSTVSQGGYYGYLQGILYAPVFLLTDDPYLRYDLMIILNDIIMSFIPVIIFHLGRKAVNLPKFPAVFFSLIAGLYPAYMLLTKFTWNETMCNILPWLFLLVAFKSVDCESKVKKQLLSCLGALVLIAGYATHGRMLSLMAAGVVLFLLYFIVTKKRIFCFTGFFATLIVGFIGDKLLKEHFQNALWLLDETNKTPTNTIEKMIGKILDMDAEAIGNFFKTLIGHFFYFISSTWGFGAIALVLIISALFMYFKHRSQIKKATKAGTEPPEAYISDNEALLTLFSFLIMGAGFAVSVFFKCTSSLIETRADTMIYGRYTEVFYPIAIFAMLILIYRSKLTLLHSFTSLVTASVINTLTMLLVSPVVTNAERQVTAMIVGLVPMRYGEVLSKLPTNETFLKIIVTNMAVLMVIVAIQLIRKNDRNIYKFIAFPMAGLLIYSNVLTYFTYMLSQSKNSQAGATYMEEAIDKIADSDYTIYCVNIAKERYVKAQFLYEDKEFVIVKNLSSLAKLPERPDFVIGTREDMLNVWVEDFKLVGDIMSNTQLFACTDEAVEWAKEHGLTVSDMDSAFFTGGNIMATSTVEQTETQAIMPDNSAIYTPYFNVNRAGQYFITVRGDNLDKDDITITFKKDKGGEEIDYTIKEQSDGELTISFIATKKIYEDVRFKISNNTGDTVTVDSLEFYKSDSIKDYPVATISAE